MALQNTAIQSINTFLGNSYYIPNYQREYSWEEPELADFWLDLTALMKEPDDATHFFGQVVIHNDESNRKKYIIDGQQRTITSTIFMRALQVFYEKIYMSDSTLRRADYKKSDISAIHIGRYEGESSDNLHLHLGELDNDFFRTFIQLGLPGDIPKQKRKAHERLRKAYVFFYSQLSEKINAVAANDDKLDILDEFYKAFTQKFNVLYMEATKLDEAFVIFETLNARGKELETADLLKNFIFSQSKDTGAAQKQWNSMISTLDRADPTKYIRHYWNSVWPFTREKDLYREISKKIKNNPRASKELLNNLSNCAACYHDMSISNPSDSSYFNDNGLLKSLTALKTLKASSFYPVVLSMVQVSSFSESDIACVVKAIESYVFRNFTICGKVANKSEIFFADIAQDIYNGVLDSAESISDKIKSEFVSDTEFKDMFLIWSGSKSTKETVRYILRKIHGHLDRTNEINVDNSEVHIEHIMPECNDIWCAPSEIHEAYLWRLGNLALLSGTFNRSISNKLFADKKSRYTASKIEPNKEIATNAEWTEVTIEQRQKQFAEYAAEIWKK